MPNAYTPGSALLRVFTMLCTDTPEIISYYLLHSLQTTDPDKRNKILRINELKGELEMTLSKQRNYSIAHLNKDDFFLRGIPIKLKANRDVDMVAMKMCGVVLKNALEELQGEKEVVMTVVRNDGPALK